MHVASGILLFTWPCRLQASPTVPQGSDAPAAIAVIYDIYNGMYDKFLKLNQDIDIQDHPYLEFSEINTFWLNSLATTIDHLGSIRLAAHGSLDHGSIRALACSI